MSGGFLAGFSSAWAAETLIATSLLLGFVLLVRRPAARAFGPQLAYWLWALPALRMALPPLPASWREAAALPVASASETVLVYFSPAVATDPVVADTGFPWLLAIGAAWTIGATLFFIWHGAAHFAYVRRILAPPATRARLADGTTLVESGEAVGPVAFGVLRRFVAVPTDFADRWDADERRLALAHELGHHARGDLIANWIALAVLALHWWNPLAWAAYRKFRADQEMANDARVLAGLPPMERHAYACAIVKAAHGRAVTAACHLHTIEDLKGRLRMLKNNRKSRRVLAAGAMGIGALTVVGLGLTASSAAAEKIRTVATTQVTAITDVVAPTPPAPPAPAAPVRTAKKVVIVKGGKTVTYEGADADAYLAEHADVRADIDSALVEAREARRVGERARVEGLAAAAEARHEAAAARAEARAAAGKWPRRSNSVVIRSKDGKVTRYEGPATEAYWQANPGMAPLVPPTPPAPGVAVAPVPPTMIKNGRIAILQPGGKKYTITMPRIVERSDCKGGDKSEFVVRKQDGSKAPITIICRNRIDTFAASQAKFAASQAKLGQVQARFGMLQALSGLETGRRAIEANRNLSDAQRAEALAGLASAKAELERQLRDTKAD